MNGKLCFFFVITLCVIQGRQGLILDRLFDIGDKDDNSQNAANPINTGLNVAKYFRNMIRDGIQDTLDFNSAAIKLIGNIVEDGRLAFENMLRTLDDAREKFMSSVMEEATRITKTIKNQIEDFAKEARAQNNRTSACTKKAFEEAEKLTEEVINNLFQCWDKGDEKMNEVGKAFQEMVNSGRQLSEEVGRLVSGNGQLTALPQRVISFSYSIPRILGAFATSIPEATYTAGVCKAEVILESGRKEAQIVGDFGRCLTSN